MAVANDHKASDSGYEDLRTEKQMLEQRMDRVVPLASISRECRRRERLL